MALTRRVALLLVLVGWQLVTCAAAQNATTVAAADHLSLEELSERLQACPIVRELDAAKLAHYESQPASSTARLFGLLFPSSRPAVNALLATLYISGLPNFLLALCPTDIEPLSLSVMVAFAVLLGLGILVGFMAFVAMDKGLRIATGGGGGHDTGHGHSHAQRREQEAATTVSATGVDTAKGQVKARKKKVDPGQDVREDRETINPSLKLGGYLNLIADFTHITDGLDMSASFYASPTVGATTTMAVFFHEIPHEVGDFALLVQSGFSKRAAMASQFVTTVGALLGTLIVIAVQELDSGGGGGSSSSEVRMTRNAGLWGTSLSWGDMLLPFTAGTFLYVGTVAVIPELLETGPDKRREVGKTLVQFAAVAAGAGVMLFISWHD